MFMRKIRLVTLFLSVLMFVHSFTLLAVPVAYLSETINTGMELEGWLCSVGEPESLPANTLVTLKTTRTITSKDIRRGEEITLRVAYDVMVKGKTIIPAGTLAIGRITHVRKPRLWGKPGEIALMVEELQLEGRTIALSSDAVREEGESRATAAWIWFGVSMIILWPCIFVPFFLKGRHAVVPANTSVDAFTTQSLM